MSLTSILFPNAKDVVSKRIYGHDQCVKILEAINSMHCRRACTVDNIGMARNLWFPRMLAEYEHRLVIIDMAINRLEQRYRKALQFLIDQQ